MTVQRRAARTVEAAVAQPALRASSQLDAFVSMLHCPYCGLGLERTWPQRGEALPDFAVLQCPCHAYPIVGGIPILQQVDGLDRVIEHIKNGERERATLQALDVFRVTWAQRSLWHRAGYWWNCRRLVEDREMVFADAVQRVRRPKVFADYLVHRYANPSFLAAIGAAMVLGEAGRRSSGGAAPPVPAGEPVSPRILDFACGAGHASFLIQLLHPGVSVLSVDQDFVSLYLARRFLAPEALHLCWDAEAPSPLPDGCVDAVFCLDAFHYFKGKKTVVSELTRVAKPDALWVFPHLHNRLQRNLVAGVPLSPAGYEKCFGSPDGRLFDEAAMLRGLSHERRVDLTTRTPDRHLDAAPTLTFVRGPREVWRVHPGFQEAFRRDPARLAINPIYRARADRGAIDLELQWPNDTFRAECASVTAALPERWRLDAADRSPLDGDVAGRLDELTTRFVLVPLPERYRRRDPVIEGG